METINIGQVRTDSREQLLQVAELLFGTTDSADWNIANNTSLFTGRHAAAFQGGQVVAYADCLPDGSLSQAAGPEWLTGRLMELAS
mgnify:CR=1 FL=1